jgi:hypothetical protein
MMGAIMRQGPHQGAQKSTRTGTSDFKTASSQVASVTGPANERIRESERGGNECARGERKRERERERERACIPFSWRREREKARLVVVCARAGGREDRPAGALLRPIGARRVPVFFLFSAPTLAGQVGPLMHTAMQAAQAEGPGHRGDRPRRRKQKKKRPTLPRRPDRGGTGKRGTRPRTPTPAHAPPHPRRPGLGVPGYEPSR